jgi:hypothetical protein
MPKAETFWDTLSKHAGARILGWGRLRVSGNGGGQLLAQSARGPIVGY